MAASRLGARTLHDAPRLALLVHAGLRRWPDLAADHDFRARDDTRLSGSSHVLIAAPRRQTVSKPGGHSLDFRAASARAELPEQDIGSIAVHRGQVKFTVTIVARTGHATWSASFRGDSYRVPAHVTMIGRWGRSPCRLAAAVTPSYRWRLPDGCHRFREAVSSLSSRCPRVIIPAGPAGRAWSRSGRPARAVTCSGAWS